MGHFVAWFLKRSIYTCVWLAVIFGFVSTPHHSCFWKGVFFYIYTKGSLQRCPRVPIPDMRTARAQKSDARVVERMLTHRADSSTTVVRHHQRILLVYSVSYNFVIVVPGSTQHYEEIRQLFGSLGLWEARISQSRTKAEPLSKECGYLGPNSPNKCQCYASVPVVRVSSGLFGWKPTNQCQS